ncbi:hypothetical protein LINPERHAP1_LOCUS421 [Linum perenne]
MVRGNPEIPAIDVNHPFYIGANDNLGTLLVSTVLSGLGDYFSWARSMKRVLMMKNKLVFVTGAYPFPSPGDSTYAAWERANVLVLGWLNKAMSAEIAQSVLWLDSARKVWVDLEERFSRSNLVRISDLHDQISNFRQVRGYFQSEQIIRFLRGLNPCFSTVRSQIIRSEHLPTINQVFSMIVQEEQELISGSASGAATGFSAQTPAITSEPGSSQILAAGPPFKRGTKRPMCSHCGLIGHTVEKCYRKIGFPPGYQRKPRVTVNAVQATEQGAGSNVSFPVDNSGGVTISQEQYR